MKIRFNRNKSTIRVRLRVEGRVRPNEHHTIAQAHTHNGRKYVFLPVALGHKHLWPLGHKQTKTQQNETKAKAMTTTTTANPNNIHMHKTKHKRTRLNNKTTLKYQNKQEKTRKNIQPQKQHPLQNKTITYSNKNM